MGFWGRRAAGLATGATALGTALALLVPVTGQAPPAAAVAATGDAGLLFLVEPWQTTDYALARSDLRGEGHRFLVEPQDEPPYAVVAPAGDRVAVHNRDGLAVLPVDGGAPTQLWGPATLDAPVWSPDSGDLLFVEREFGPQRTLERLRVAAADGSGDRLLFTSDGSELSGLTARAWSPDRAWVAFSAIRTDDPQALEAYGHHRVRAGGGSPVAMPGVVAVARAPRGKAVYAAVRDGRRVDLVRLRANLTPGRTVHTFRGTPTWWVPDLVWSADGTKVGVLGWGGGQDRSLVVLERSGAPYASVARLPGEAAGLEYARLSLSVDGTVAAWAARPPGGASPLEGIHVRDLARGRTCQVTDTERPGPEMAPAFHPDGRTLVVHGQGLIRTLDLTRPDRPLRRTVTGGYATVQGTLGRLGPAGALTPCARPRVAREVGLATARSGGRPLLRATVTATGSKPCRNDVPVRLQRRTAGGGWTAVDRARTTGRTATFALPGRGRAFRAVAPRVVARDTACLRAVSGPVRR
jgi:hypothetical protein